jgi:hypothetical protein
MILPDRRYILSDNLSGTVRRIKFHLRGPVEIQSILRLSLVNVFKLELFFWGVNSCNLSFYVSEMSGSDI